MNTANIVRNFVLTKHISMIFRTIAGGKHQILPVGTDMDTVTTSGSYYLTNGVNTACDYSFYKIFCLSTSPDSDCFQIAYCITLNTIKTRTKANKRWSEWK